MLTCQRLGIRYSNASCNLRSKTITHGVDPTAASSAKVYTFRVSTIHHLWVLWLLLSIHPVRSATTSWLCSAVTSIAYSRHATPEKVVVIYCDAEVNHVDEYTNEDLPVKLIGYGGGGTAFEPVFDYVDANDIDPEVVIYLTDGYGDQHEFTSAHETIWVTTHCEDFNWGTVIKYEGE